MSPVWEAPTTGVWRRAGTTTTTLLPQLLLLQPATHRGLLPATGAATAGHYSGCMEGGGGIDLMRGGAHPTPPPLQLQGTMRKFVIIFLLNFTGIRRDGHLLFEVKMYLQKGCIMVSGVGSS